MIYCLQLKQGHIFEDTKNKVTCWWNSGDHKRLTIPSKRVLYKSHNWFFNGICNASQCINYRFNLTKSDGFFLFCNHGFEFFVSYSGNWLSERQFHESKDRKGCSFLAALSPEEHTSVSTDRKRRGLIVDLTLRLMLWHWS